MSRPPTDSEIDALNESLRQRPETDAVRTSFIPHENIPTPPMLTPPIEPTRKPRILANITKVVEFEDPILMTTEEIHVGKYILENPDNVVIVYGDNKYFFTKREHIYNQIDDATVYPCRTKVDNPLSLSIEEHVENQPLYDLKKIGLIVPFCDIIVFFENPQVQLFGLINNRKMYPSFISKNYIDGQSGTGALHCQDGQKSYITTMVVAVPSVEDNLPKINKRRRSRTRSRSSSRDRNVTRRRTHR